MEQADFNITFSKVIAEIDRRCNEITHPIPDDIKVIESKIETMRKLVDMMQEALAMYAANKQWEEYVETKLKEIKKREKKQ